MGIVRSSILTYAKGGLVVGSELGGGGEFYARLALQPVPLIVRKRGERYGLQR